MLALALVAVARPQIDVRWTDFTCPPDTIEEPVSIMAGTVACVRSTGAVYERALGWRERFIGMYILDMRGRVFDADLLQDDWHGPAFLFLTTDNLTRAGL